MLRKLSLLLILLAVPSLAGATRYPITAKDCRGKAVVIPGEPKRIVSLTPNNTEILFALGLDSRIVGVSKYCNYPSAATRKPKIGDRTTSVETVISLHPDLVFAHGKLNDDAIRGLEQHKVKVFAIDPKTISEVVRDIGTVGRITNREKQAASAAGRIVSTQKLVSRKIAGLKQKPRVLVAVQAEPLWAAGPRTFVDEMIKISGAANVASAAKPGFNQFSAEAAYSQSPDVIVGTTKGDKQVFTRGLWKNTKACRHHRVYEADPDLLCRPGPRLADGILLMARMIHPNVFKH